MWAQLKYARDLVHANDEIKSIEALRSRDVCAVEVHRDEPWVKLKTIVGEFRPTVIHYIGHGKKGSLSALDLASTGIPEERIITPKQLVKAFRHAPVPIRGVFLNGCETAHWAPYFVPDNGWLIGSNTTISDDVSGFFAPLFYERILTGLSDGEAFDRSMKDMEPLASRKEVPLVRWINDPAPADFLHKVFSRQAFHLPVFREASLADLGHALEGAGAALSTNSLAKRVDIAGSATIYCRHPLDATAVRELRQALIGAKFDFRQLRAEFPRLDRIPSGLTNISREDFNRLIHLADRLDGSRNQLLLAVNRYLPDAERFSMIDLSSTLN